MGKSGRSARDVFFWTFQRGTFPYDILCGLILAFIFFVPRACFAPRAKPDEGTTHEKVTQNSAPVKDGRLPRAPQDQRK